MSMPRRVRRGEAAARGLSIRPPSCDRRTHSPHKFALISNAYVASVPHAASDDGIEPALLPIELRIALTASLPIVRNSMSNSLDLDGRPQDTRVVVAMSGGVDSSITAALLKADGYDVIGVTLQLYDHGAATHRKGACCAGQDIYDARAVADRIGIPHYVLDYEKQFREAVIERFAESYIAGETPVPCIECNRLIKFDQLLATTRQFGARVLATGHYVAS